MIVANECCRIYTDFSKARQMQPGPRIVLSHMAWGFREPIADVPGYFRPTLCLSPAVNCLTINLSHSESLQRLTRLANLASRPIVFGSRITDVWYPVNYLPILPHQPFLWLSIVTLTTNCADCYCGPAFIRSSLFLAAAKSRVAPTLCPISTTLLTSIAS